MSNYKDTMAYKLYKRAEENLESGVAASNLVDKILKEVLKAVDYGMTQTMFNASDYYVTTANEAATELEGMGFKVLRNQDDYDFAEMYILWDYSEEDAKESNSNEN